MDYHGCNTEWRVTIMGSVALIVFAEVTKNQLASVWNVSTPNHQKNGNYSILQVDV